MLFCLKIFIYRKRMVDYRAIGFLALFFGLIIACLVFAIPLVITKILKKKKNVCTLVNLDIQFLMSLQYKPNGPVQIIVQIFTFLSIIAFLMAITCLSIFSYVPWWGVGIINTPLCILIFALIMGKNWKLSFNTFLLVSSVSNILI